MDGRLVSWTKRMEFTVKGLTMEFGIVLIFAGGATEAFVFDCESDAMDAMRAMRNAQNVVTIHVWGESIDVPVYVWNKG